MDHIFPLYKPFVMNLELTTKCPLKCPFCYCSLEGGYDLPLDKALYWVREAKANGVRIVNLSGGETLCYPHLIDIIREVHENKMEANIAISGYGLTKDVLEQLINAGVNMICVSLNGSTKRINDVSRNGFDLAISALRVLAQSGFKKTCINWVMQGNNADDFPGIVKLAEEYSIGHIEIIGLKPTSKHELEHLPNRNQMKRIVRFIRKYKGSVHIHIEQCYSNLIAMLFDVPGIINFNCMAVNGCTAGRVSFSISVDGSITPCRHLDIRETSKTLSEYWKNSENLCSIRQASSMKKSPCNMCYYQDACTHCLAINYARKGTIEYGFCECPSQKKGRHLIKKGYIANQPFEPFES